MAIIDFSSTVEMQDSPVIAANLLAKLAELLHGVIPGEHFVGHLREREFALILSDLSMGEVEHLADDVIERVRVAPSLRTERGQIVTVVGVGYTAVSECDAAQLMRLADVALHFGRSTGRSWHAIVYERLPTKAA